VNALIDFDDPIDQLLHLVVGSEGTLCFVESVVLDTVETFTLRAASLLCFSDVFTAADAVPTLKALNVSAVELLDWSSLRTMIGKPGTPSWLSELKSGNAALLVEVCAESNAQLTAMYQPIIAANFRGLVREPKFEQDEVLIEALWRVRSGLFPVVGARRPIGSMVIIGDVAVAVDRLGLFVSELRSLFESLGFEQAVIFGHAREGNLHFMLTPDLSDEGQRKRFERLMTNVVELVVDRFDGSLKAEHGTGRAMAPFVQREWGDDIYRIMTRLKAAFDPLGILNPGVLINSNPTAHMEHLKQIPSISDTVDYCIECGFCEPSCPTTAFNYSPRQRIAALRLETLGFPSDVSEASDTCVACGHCESACPVGIDTSKVLATKQMQQRPRLVTEWLKWQSRHWKSYIRGARWGVQFYRLMASYQQLNKLLSVLHRKIPHWVPQWLPPVKPTIHPRTTKTDQPIDVSILVNCAERVLQSSGTESSLLSLCHQAGLNAEVVNDSLCCGQKFQHLGETALATKQRSSLIDRTQRTIIVAEASSCYAVLEQLGTGRIVSLWDFLLRYVLPNVELQRFQEPIAVHVGCTLRSASEQSRLTTLLNAVASDWQYSDLGCCGGQGERQFFEEHHSKQLIESSKLKSTERMVVGINSTCEAALTRQLGCPVISLSDLVLRSMPPA